MECEPCGGGCCRRISYAVEKREWRLARRARTRPSGVLKISAFLDVESVSHMIDRPSETTLTLTLPDGSQRTVPAGTLPSEVVKSIGERLLQAAVAVDINGAIQDLVTPLRTSGPFRVLTD